MTYTLREELKINVTNGPYMAQLRAYDGVECAIVSSISAPPGARLELLLQWQKNDQIPLEKPDTLLRLKVHRCRQQIDQSFLIIGRLFDLHRDTRTALEDFARISDERCAIERW